MESLTPVPSASIFRLSNDILYSILLLSYKSQKEDFFPIVMSLVCRSWRSVIIESPILWSEIVFDRPPPFDRQRLWIARSKEAALAIKVTHSYNTKQTIQLIHLIRSHVGRWRSILISSESLAAKSFRLFFDELRHEQAAMLEEVDAVQYGKIHGWTFQPFSSAPRLKKLCLGYGRLKGDTALFSHLNYLAIQYPTFDCPPPLQCITTGDLFQIFSSAALTLEFAYIEVLNCRTHDESDALSHPVTLHNLNRLVLSSRRPPSAPPSWVPEIYSGILAPSMLYHSFDTSTLHHLMSRGVFPFPNLLDLTITNSDGLDARRTEDLETTYRSVLSQLPQLQELVVESVASFNHLLLVGQCSRLQKLTLQMSKWSRYETSGLQGVIEARRLLAHNLGGKDPLEDVVLRGYELPEEEVSWLKGHIRSFEYTKSFW